MPVNAHITDPATKLKAEVVLNEDCDCNALIVATVPLRTFDNELRFFINDDYGSDMNQGTSATGTPLEIYNADDTLWTATNIVGGKMTAVSADRPHTGTNSLKVDKMAVDDVYQIANPAGDINMALYTSLTIWANIDKDWKAGDIVDLYGWDTSTGLQIGTEVDLSDYFSYLSYDTWQKINIPLTDMGDLSASTTLDALRVRQVAAEGKAPKYYLDDIQFEEKVADETTAIEFEIKPDTGTWMYVEGFRVIIAGPYSGILDVADATENATMPKLPYNSLLNVAKLDSGISYRRWQDGKIRNSNQLKQLLDLLSFGDSEIAGYGSDGTNTWVTVKIGFSVPILLKPENEDRLTLTVNDDLSSLLVLRVAAGTKVEAR